MQKDQSQKVADPIMKQFSHSHRYFFFDSSYANFHCIQFYVIWLEVVLCCANYLQIDWSLSLYIWILFSRIKSFKYISFLDIRPRRSFLPKAFTFTFNELDIENLWDTWTHLKLLKFFHNSKHSVHFLLWKGRTDGQETPGHWVNLQQRLSSAEEAPPCELPLKRQGWNVLWTSSSSFYR